MLLPVSLEVKTQYGERDMLTMVGFLFGVYPQFNTRKSQIPSGSKVFTLNKVFTRLL